MFLPNPFPNEVRYLYLYEHGCHHCGRSNKGLELNHITGRDSSSAFNASLLCVPCHGHVGHSQEEEIRLFKMNLTFLLREKYKPTEKDYDFLREHPHLLRAFSHGETIPKPHIA